MSKPARVLFIEDDEVEGRALLRMVHEKGLPWEVMPAGTLAQARMHLARSRFDVIVADNHLPDGESTELFGEIPDTPFVLITGTLEEQLALRTLERGADDYLIKDVEHRHLEALPFAVQKTLYRKAIRERERRLTRELLESEEKFRTMAEHLQAACGIIQGERLVYANPCFVRLSGYSMEELLSMHFQQVVHPDFRPMMVDRARRRQRGEPVPSNYEFLLLTKSGEARWLDFSAARIEYQGQPAIIGAGFDITERKRAEAAQAQSQQRLAGIIDSAMDAIITVDEQQRIVQFNPAAERMFACPAQEALGSLIDRFIPPRFREVHREHIRDFARTGNTARAMGHLRPLNALRADGEEFPIEASISQVQVGEHKLFTVILRDITERQRAQAQLQEAKERAEAANRAKDQFLAVLSHELRNPLAPVLATASMLQTDERYDSETREHLEVIRRNAELEARLIDDLLDVTRIARGKVTLDRRPIALCTVLRRAIEVCQPDIEARNLEFGLDVKGGPFLVDGDAARLQQVFWNLLKNAVKFTAHGGCVGVRCRREESDECRTMNDEGASAAPRRAEETEAEALPASSSRITRHSSLPSFAVVEVMDSGVGIAPAALLHIFKPFEQEERSPTRQFGGLGLGLTISKAIVELHGGTIEAHSDGKGKGATFTVRLPIADLRLPIAATESVAPHGKSAIGNRKLAILLVEDHGDTARIMRRLLKAEGHEVETAGDVATAMEAARRGHFDLLLSDLGLPDGSGLDILRQLVAEGGSIPAIALSGYGQEQDIAQSRAAGFAAHLTKPVNMDQLVSTIVAVTGQGESCAT